MRVPKGKLESETCGIYFPGDGNGEGHLDGGLRCQAPAEIVVPWLGGLGGIALCSACANMVVQEIQKDLT